jgi:hypothetical protein
MFFSVNPSRDRAPTMRSCEKPPNLTPEDVVNAFLVERFEVCLEDVISDAAAGVIRAQLSPVVEATSSCLARWHDEDGALAELFGGLLAVDGVRYAWRASIFTDLDGKRYLTDLVEFRPLDWATVMKVAR